MQSQSAPAASTASLAPVPPRDETLSTTLPQPMQSVPAPVQALKAKGKDLQEGDWVVVADPPSPPKPTPPSTSSRPPPKGTFTIPNELVKPGMEMLKVSAKSARRVKPRRVWLELASETPDDGELGLEVGIGVVGGQDVRLCWEKNGGALGFARSANFASVPLSRIRDLRFGSAGSPYRTSLHLPQSVEARWVTIIYAVPSPSSFLGNVTGSPAFKLVHFIAPSTHELELWQKTLEGFKEGRMAKAIVEGEDAGQHAAACPEAQEKVVKEEEVHQLCQRLGMGMSKAEISEAFKKTAEPNDYLDFRSFQNFVKLLKRRWDIEGIFQSLLRPDSLGLNLTKWSKFLKVVQGVTLSDDDIRACFDKYASPADKLVNLDGFVLYLMSSDNAPIKDESQQDMTRPLPEYFISSSHNTYLIGSQFQGQSTVEGYIRALQQGCRSVELDVWDGDDGEPIVTHGMTLTTKIPVRNVLLAIAQYAFLASPYPVVLSVEVHCELAQQDKLATILHETLRDRLVCKPLEAMEKDKEIEKLPSPAELKGKFLLKAKNKFITTTTANDNGFPIKMVPAADDSSSSEFSSSHSSSDGDFKNSKFYRAIRNFRASSDNIPTRRSLSRESSSRPSLTSRTSRSSIGSTVSAVPIKSPTAAPAETITVSELSVSPTQLPVPSPAPAHSPATLAVSSPPPLPTKPKDMAMSQSLASLLIYTIGVKARGFNKKEKYAPTHVISLGESRVAKMLRDEAARQDFVAHNRGHLTRAYPRGRRLTSSNYAPHHMWAAGVQLVALNWQTFDVGMELNSAMFSRANRVGYVLKPEYLRQKGPEKDKVAALRSEKYRLDLEIISAQQLPRPRPAAEKDGVEQANLDPFVEASLFVPGVVQPQKRRTPVVLGNAFNPTFRSFSTTASTTSSSSQFSFTFSSHPSPGMLDLVFLRFEVLNAKGNVKAAMEEGKGEFVGAYCISVGALMPGYRHLPLYDTFGDQHLFSTLERPPALPRAFVPTVLVPSSRQTRGPCSPPSGRAVVIRSVHLARTLNLGSSAGLPQAARCPVQPEPISVGEDWKPEEDAEYVKKAVERLQGAVRIRTESFDDMAGPEDPRFDAMGELHKYLEATFPRVYGTVEVEKVQKWGLLLTWKGKEEGLKPVVLMAHQDTVPVPDSTLSRWTYPPFDAHVDEEGWIWGRGTADCKNTLISLFAALDKLMEDGFEPKRTIILSSGFDEEIGGSRSAAHLARALEDRYGPNGIALIVDEGFTGVDHLALSSNPSLLPAVSSSLLTGSGGKAPLAARFGMAEKGAVSVTLDVLTQGGHSSVPHGPHTAIGILSRLIVALEDNVDVPRLEEGSPVLQQLDCLAEYGEVSREMKRRIRDPRKWKGLGEELAREDEVMRAFLSTTQATDLIQGGVKLNALPELATASINYRIAFTSSVNATLTRISSILSPVVHSLNYTFSSFGSHPDATRNVVRLSILGDSPIEPAPISPSEGPAWELMAGTARHVWPGVVAASSGMIANTDTKHYWTLTPNIYRFVPGSLEEIKNFHTVDERIHTNAHVTGITYFYHLLQNTNEWETS
ncbi:hypothetical protein JCM8547_007400 [Rhodosporidiobolus lusitaniae]